MAAMNDLKSEKRGGKNVGKRSAFIILLLGIV